MPVRFSLAAVIAAAFAGAIAAAAGQAPAATLSVTGDVTAPLTLTAADLAAMPRSQLEVQEGAKTQRYDGVLVADLLAKAGVPVGKSLHGKALARAVLASASDDYHVALSIAELDPVLTRSRILVADRVDGQPLAEPQGPFKLVVPGDTHNARAVRMLVRLQVVQLAK
jgi:DMSO/TMAO reductase YedYZ molybdopterin-dependent catalytic subunit